MSGGGFRASSIPSSVRKTIQTIKEIAGNHSDDDIYSMLKECSMDPNETTQKLLHLDTFHEVKRKRDKKKENLSSRESVEPRGRPGTQGRGIRGGRGVFSPHNVSHDASGSKTSITGKNNGAHRTSEKVAPPLSASQEKISKGKSSGSSAPIIANGPTTNVASGSRSVVGPSPSSAGSGDRVGPSSGDNNNSVDSASPSDNSNKIAIVASGRESLLSSSNHSGSVPASSSNVYFSSSDPVLVPSDNSWFPGAAGTIRREVGSQHSLVELNVVSSAKKKLTAASEADSSSMQGKVLEKSQGVAKIHTKDISPPPSSVTHGSPSVSRPSSNYNNRSQQSIGPHKAGSSKEWKPKPTNTCNQSSGPASASEAPPVSAEVTKQLQSASNVLDTHEPTSKLSKKLEDLHLPQRQHVILPNHIMVPDSEKNKFSFGSLGVNFGVSTTSCVGPESEKSSAPLSETSQAIEETVEEQDSSQDAAVTSEVGDYPDRPQSPDSMPENLESSEVDGSSSAIQEYESKQDTTLPSGGHQYSGVHISPNYSFGFVPPPMLGTQPTPSENSDSQTRDMSRVPSFIVHQQLDPASYYAQFYRSGPDSDGRLSPFPTAGAPAKYNGNVTVLPAPNSQSPQEGGVLSTAGPTPLVTQAAGLMQSSIAVTQQPVPVFRPHISPYPPNYIPYGHYFSPFYVPPPTIHQFLGNGAFPQPPQSSTVYALPPAVSPTGIKYPLPQFKPGSNAANPAHLVMPSPFGVYGSSPAGYNHNSAATSGNSTSNEDLGSSQFKESNIYISGQQSEGSAVWMAAPGREITNLPTSSFYNLPPQGQHVTFAPTQAGHGTFGGIYHPAQAVSATAVHPMLQQPQTMAGAVDMVGPGGNVYQQPQPTQINWPSNY